MADSNDRVTLVALETLTPYRRNEVFTVSKADAERLLNPNFTKNDFGPIYSKVKVRVFDPEKDKQLLLDNGVLNKKAHAALEEELHPTSKK